MSDLQFSTHGFIMGVLTEDRCCNLGLKPLMQAGGFPERGSHSSQSDADLQPARRRQGFFFWRGLFSRQSASANGHSGPHSGHGDLEIQALTTAVNLVLNEG